MTTEKLNLELKYKPDFAQALHRVNAWYQNEIIDRPPVQFCTVPCSPFITSNDLTQQQLKEKWFDIDKVIDDFEQRIDLLNFQAETFPVFWPNLGPVIYAAFFGTEIVFEKTTSWSKDLPTWQDILKVDFNPENEYFKQIDKMTYAALKRAKGKYMVGYTDLHPGLDCVAAWRKNEKLCIDLYDSPSQVEKAIELATKYWHRIYNHFDDILKAHNQLSVAWMNIPSLGKMHIPSCDFAAMISTEQFEQFCLPAIIEEMKGMTHNIFHLDGPGVARHLDVLLQLPQINAIQWVQGAGNGEPIMQWIPMLKKIQKSNKSLVVYLDKSELENFIDEMSPKGLFLCINEQNLQQQNNIIDMLKKW